MSICIPRPFAIAIDDLGWINGTNDGESGYGPYRLGINRKTTIADYQALVDLAKLTKTRLQGLFILSEWDRTNICAQYPTTTHLRGNWKNVHVSDLQFEIVDFLKKNAAYLEFGLHGVGHESWPQNGQRHRAEWYNTDLHQPWPEEQIEAHIACFKGILDQYQLNPAHGHSFPESFVPCAYSYYWNPTERYSLGAILGKNGVKFANTDFSQITECQPPTGINGGGIDHGVHVINRLNYGNEWLAEDTLPSTPLSAQGTDYIETHWPNLLAKNGDNQSLTTQKWKTYFDEVNQTENRYCSKNTQQHHSQWVYHTYCSIYTTGSEMILDATAIPSEYLQWGHLGALVLKTPNHMGVPFLDGKPPYSYDPISDHTLWYFGALKQATYKLHFDVYEGLVVVQNGTFQVLSQPTNAHVTLKIYGTQSVHFKGLTIVEKVLSTHKDVEILSVEKIDADFIVTLRARNIQGETTELLFS